MTFILHSKKQGRTGKAVYKVEQDNQIYWINHTDTATEVEVEKKLNDLLTEEEAEKKRLAEIEALVKANT